jgi:hypothetical protein
MTGSIIDVRITSAADMSLSGEIIKNVRINHEQPVANPMTD